MSLDDSSAPGTTLKKALCCNHPGGETYDKYQYKSITGIQKMCLLRKDSEYVPRQGCKSLLENRIKGEGIQHDKRCAQGKAGQDAT